MRRRLFFPTLLAPLAQAQPSRPNIIFILADDMGWGDLSCYGNRGMKTPGIDRLAREGTLFTQFYVGGSVCSPSRTAFTTGHYPARHRVHGHFATAEMNAKRGMPDFLDPRVPTLARQLGKAGYRTAHFGKWHLGHNPGAPMPDAYGFAEHKSVTSNETRWIEAGPGFRAESSRVFVDWSIDFITRNRAEPFYLQLWTLLPHAPLAPTPEQLAPFVKDGPIGGHLGAHQIYNASLRDLDTQIGRLLAKLDELGLAENTIVVFSSDNGPEDIHIRNASHSAYGSPGPFRGRKRSLYEGGIRVPFLVRWPAKVPKGGVNDTTVVTAVDLLPTLLHFAGVAPEQNAALDGENLQDVFAGKPRLRSRPVFWEWRFQIAGYYANKSPMLAIRDAEWKLLMNPDGSRVELYNIPKDPWEMTNMAFHHPSMVKNLRGKLLSWQRTLPPGPVDPGAGQLDYPMPKGNL
ncbi:MAG: N-acetylgalactosamine 6-sulfate sulfatase (GALNS) [Acidobacteria bacterium]|nr:N-acetylgalactosamine 6-sulfate sulfatase (GALNS) [Acidobacteriota bacterium]